MKMLKDVRKQVDSAADTKERIAPIENASIKLSDEEMNIVSGGGTPTPPIKREEKDR